MGTNYQLSVSRGSKPWNPSWDASGAWPKWRCRLWRNDLGREDAREGDGGQIVGDGGLGVWDAVGGRPALGTKPRGSVAGIE